MNDADETGTCDNTNNTHPDGHEAIDNVDESDDDDDVHIRLENHEGISHEIKSEQQITEDTQSNTSNIDNSKNISSSETPRSVVNSNVLPKVKSTVLARPSGGNEWRRLQVISRGGKATGKYVKYLNVLDTDTNKPECVNWDTISEWKPVEEEVLVSELCNIDEVLAAKFVELEKWKEFDVYNVVQNEGQAAISTRWVCTKKDDVVKARLVARGYEDNDATEKNDSPTCEKSNMRILFTIASWKKWDINFLDIKSAFLQGEELTRAIYLRPPVEANTNSLWLLKKTCLWTEDSI